MMYVNLIIGLASLFYTARCADIKANIQHADTSEEQGGLDPDEKLAPVHMLFNPDLSKADDDGTYETQVDPDTKSESSELDLEAPESKTAVPDELHPHNPSNKSTTQAFKNAGNESSNLRFKLVPETAAPQKDEVTTNPNAAAEAVIEHPEAVIEHPEAVIEHPEEKGTNTSRKIDFLRRAKPHVPEKYHEEFFPFIVLGSSLSCQSLAKSALNNSLTFAKGVALSNLVTALSVDEPKTPEEKLAADKTVAVALEKLHFLFADSLPRFNYHESLDVKLFEGLLRCYVDQVEKRTILQSIIAQGMTRAFQGREAMSLFSKNITDKSITISPLQHLDRNGNNLLHLAVLSNTKEMYHAVLNFANDISRNAREALNWEISALEHQNFKNQKPVDVASWTMKADLKASYRTIATFLSKT